MSSPEDRLEFVRAINSPDLLNTDFPEDEENIVKLPSVSDEEVDAFFDSLEPVPEEERPRIDRIIQKALDKIKISHQRHKPSSN